MNEVFKTVIAGLEIILLQDKRNASLFTVQYGSTVHSELNYTQAAYVLGECIMHVLAFEGVFESNL